MPEKLVKSEQTLLSISRTEEKKGKGKECGVQYEVQKTTTARTGISAVRLGRLLLSTVIGRHLSQLVA
jgi:hypothetical protein